MAGESTILDVNFANMISVGIMALGIGLIIGFGYKLWQGKASGK